MHMLYTIIKQYQATSNITIDKYTSANCTLLLQVKGKMPILKAVGKLGLRDRHFFNNDIYHNIC